MGAENSDLWQRLVAHRIGPADASLSFADRLARENRWSDDFAERVLTEYRRFCYLAKTAGHEVTPSDAVDQAWHLHLTYSRDYWQVFCPKVLQSEFHHGPTAGGVVERSRYYQQYAVTLKSYEEAFGAPPPTDIWPDARQRFVDDPQAFRVKPSDAIVITRAKLPMVLLVGMVLLAAAWLGGGL